MCNDYWPDEDSGVSSAFRSPEFLALEERAQSFIGESVEIQTSDGHAFTGVVIKSLGTVVLIRNSEDKYFDLSSPGTLVTITNLSS